MYYTLKSCLCHWKNEYSACFAYTCTCCVIYIHQEMDKRFYKHKCGHNSGFRWEKKLHLLIALANVDANKLYFYILHPPASLSERVSVGPPTLKPGCIKVQWFHFLIITCSHGFLTLNSPQYWKLVLILIRLIYVYACACMHDLCITCRSRPV